MNKLLSLLIVLKASVGFAQSDLQNTGIIYISGSPDTLYVNASMTNTSVAALTNNGNLYITQTLTNAQSGMAVGTGTLYLNGVSSQSVAGSQPFKTLNLVTGNTAGIVLNNNLQVSGVHTFANGIISSFAASNFLVYEAGSSYTGDGDSRHVSGWVKKFGNSNFIFPVGNGSVERPVQIASLTTSSEFTARHYQATTNTSNLQSPLLSVDPYEYWQINRIAGGNANVNMNWNNPKLTFPQYLLSSIRAAYYTAGLWTNVGGSATGDVTTTGNITSNTMTNFGAFTFGSISAMLPLNFLSTNAFRKPNSTLVEWKTANEVNVHHFEVEKSTDGHHFVKIGSVPSQINPGAGEYTFTDTHAGEKRIYYRIRSVDNDGKYLFSRIVLVVDGTQHNEELYVSNPVTNRIYLNVNSLPAGNYNYQLLGNDGQLVQSGTITITGTGLYSIGLINAVRPGIYVLTLGNLNFIRNEKLRIL